MATWQLLSGIHSDKTAVLVKRALHVAETMEEMQLSQKNDAEGSPNRKTILRTVCTQVEIEEVNGKRIEKNISIPSIYAGEIFNSDKDLEKHNIGDIIRFKRMPDYEPINSESESQDDGLSKMKVPELQALAEREEIDLEGCTLKQDIINTIRSVVA